VLSGASLIQALSPKSEQMARSTPKMRLSLAALALVVPLTLHGAEKLERDSKYRFTVQRPAQWIIQDPPFEATRVMLGIEGDGFVGNCNVVVAEVAESAGASFRSIDEGVNKTPAAPDHFAPGLRAISADARVTDSKVVRRGAHSGQLVNYTYSYVSPALKRRIHGRAELFSHSRPGRNYAFTCVAFALSPSEAQRAFDEQSNAFRRFSASFKPDE
jgi:hypothetical protein